MIEELRVSSRSQSALKTALALTLFLSTLPLLALEVELRVVDPQTNRPLADLPVIIMETRQRVFTDGDGRARVELPEPGFYTFRLITPDDQILQPRLEVLRDGQELLLLAGTPPQVAAESPATGGGRGEQFVEAGESIVVSGSRDRQSLGRHEVRLDEIKRIPGQMGDALRGLETLPGINPPPFGGGDIVVRGANPNANTYLLDDLPLGYAWHFGGLNQVIHNELISTIDLYTGSFPANYGNATGGVIAIESIDQIEKFGGHSSFSLWSTSHMLEGPVGNGGHWFAAGRISYLHLVLKPYIPDGIRPPIYWDGQWKFEWRLTPSQALTFYFIGAKDTVAVHIEDKPAWDPTSEPDPIFIGARAAADQAFHTEALRHTFQPSSRLRNRLTIYNHDNISYFDGSIGIYKAKQRRTDGWAALQNDLLYELWADHLIIEGGVELRRLNYRMEGDTLRILRSGEPVDFFDRNNPSFEVIPVEDRVVENYHSAYAMMTLRGYGFEFRPGLRSEHFGLSNHTVTDPRGTLSWTFDRTNTTFVVGGGTYHRLPEPWQYSPSAGNPYLKMERAEHHSGGIEQRFQDGWSIKLEAYKHYFTDIVVADHHLTVPVRRNPSKVGLERFEKPLLFNDRLGWSNDGTGHSEGWDLMIRRQLPKERNGLYGWLSVSWAKTMRNDHQPRLTDEMKNQRLSADERRILSHYDNTKDFYADFDRTWIVNLVLGWRLSREWQFGMRWNYRTSIPIHPIVGDNGGQQQNNGRPIFEPIQADYEITNSMRLKPYHRLDLRVDRFFHYGWGYGSIFFEALNVYVRNNPERMTWSRQRPFSRTNPQVVYDFGSLQLPSDSRQKVFVPLFNIGMEIKF